MDARKRCRFTITSLQQAFQWGVEDLKTVKSRLDLEILKKADVIGMTTTGKCGQVTPSLYMLIYVTIGGSAYTYKRPEIVPYTKATVRALLGLKLD